MNLANFKTLIEFVEYFKDEATCVADFTATRFEDGEYCPHCNHGEIYTFKDGKRYRCASCRKDFTIRTGTVFGESKLPLRKWYMAAFLISNSRKGISSVKLAEDIGVTQKTAWFMAHRLRQSHEQDETPMKGTLEADETWIGGKSKNMHARIRRQKITGTGGTNKTPVFGIKNRNGEVRAQVLSRVESSATHPILKANIAPGSTLYTDEHRCYYNLQKDFKRGVVRHGIKEYVVGDCHTNGIESFWAILKRGYHGIYHWMSVKHLQRYVNEFVFRFNMKSLGVQEKFSSAIHRLADSARLTYKQLIQQTI